MRPIKSIEDELEMELRRELERGKEVAPTWKPQPGEILVGRVLEIKRGVKTRVGENDVMVIQKENGERVSVWKSPSTEHLFDERNIGRVVRIQLEPIWKPTKPGEILKGRIVGIRRDIPTKYGGRNDLMVIQTSDGRRIGVWKKAALEDYFNEENVGKMIGILYVGRTTGRRGTSYDKFVVKLKSVS